MTLKEYFLDQNEKISYIQLKVLPEFLDFLKDEQLKGDLYFPVPTEELTQGLLGGDFQEEVGSSYLVKGMLLNIAIDEDFYLVPIYRKVLEKLLENPSDYAMSLGNEGGKNALLYLRAAYLLNPKSYFACYSYARMLWRTQEMEKDLEEERVKTAEGLLEKCLHLNPDHPLAYFELGNINSGTGHYLKAKSYYAKALERTDIPEIQEQVREQMRIIEPQAQIEDAIYFINRTDYGRAIESLQKAAALETRLDVYYYLGVCYENLDMFEEAIENFEQALKLGADFGTLYVDLVYCYYAAGKVQEAYVIASQALKDHPADLKLRYNRSILAYELGRTKEAISDLDFILSYDDLSDEFFSQVMSLKKALSE